MTEMIREAHLHGIDTTSDVHGGPRTGLVFVPCTICLAPLDLVVITETDHPQLCERHLVADFLPLN